MRSMRTDSASSARHRSSPSPVTFEYLIPGSGLNSNVVTTGPGWICWTDAHHFKFGGLLLQQRGSCPQFAFVNFAARDRRMQQCC